MMFGCCSSWWECVLLGYCVRYDYRQISEGHYVHDKDGKLIEEYAGHRIVKDCNLGRRCLIDKDRVWLEKWQSDAKEIACEKGYPAANEKDRQKFNDEIFQSKNQSGKYAGISQEKFRTSSENPNSARGEYVDVGIYLKEGKFTMKNLKVIKSKDGLNLVSWTHKDIVHYGIQDDDSQMLEVFKPTISLKGNALRSYVLKIFDERTPQHYSGHWKSVAMCTDDINVGDIIAFEGTIGSIIFSKVKKITPSLIISISNRGGQNLWIPKLLDEKLQNQTVYVISEEDVPQEYRTWVE